MWRLVKPNRCHKSLRFSIQRSYHNPERTEISQNISRSLIYYLTSSHYHYYSYNIYFGERSREKGPFFFNSTKFISAKSPLAVAHTGDYRDTTRCVKGKRGRDVSLKRRPFRFRQENSRANIISSRSNLFDVVSVRNLYSTAQPGAMRHRLKSTRRLQTQATRSALRVYARVCTQLYIHPYVYLCECVRRRCPKFPPSVGES